MFPKKLVNRRKEKGHSMPDTTSHKLSKCFRNFCEGIVERGLLLLEFLGSLWEI